MEAFESLAGSLSQFVSAGGAVLYQLLAFLLPWVPLGAWIGFWLCAVNWQQLRGLLKGGGWVGIVLIGVVMVLAWGVIAPPASGHHNLFGLQLSNFVGKTVYITGLFTIMLLCGSVQLSGCCASYSQLEEEAAAADSHAHGQH